MAGAALRTRTFMVRHADAVLAAGLMGVLVTLIVPLPTPILDVLLACNFAYVLLMMMVVLGLNSPLELSTFPTLLLIGTLFRLALKLSFAFFISNITLLKQNSSLALASLLINEVAIENLFHIMILSFLWSGRPVHIINKPLQCSPYIFI